MPQWTLAADDHWHLHANRAVAVGCIVLGVAARVAGFGCMPPGLNQDEASIGYESWSLLHYGIDRNGAQWPIHLISWGSGQNALYAYLAMPFVAFGLTPLTVRLPLLVSALASLPLVWLIARRLFDEKSAWSATAVTALSPWHIMLSRWALESNLLPFVFLSGLAVLAVAVTDGGRSRALASAGALFGLCLYAYGTAYLAVPLFLTTALVIGVLARMFTILRAILAFVAFLVVSLPIVLFVALNTFRWDSIALGSVTVPRLPVAPRFETQLADSPLLHVKQLWSLIVTQSDGLSWNITEPFGVLYSSVAFVIAFVFLVATTFLVARKHWPAERSLVAIWFVACVPVGIVQEPNINRVNLLLMALVFATGVGLAWVDSLRRGLLVVALTGMVIGFGFFAHTYFTTQRSYLASAFFEGLLPALEQARTQAASEEQICVTGEVDMPYVYALFAERVDPRDYLRTVEYVDPIAPFRQVRAFGRYTFDLKRCDYERAAAVVARRGEHVPSNFAVAGAFGQFEVRTRR